MRISRTTIVFAVIGAAVLASAGAVILIALDRNGSAHLVKTAETEARRDLLFLLAEAAANTSLSPNGDLVLEGLTAPDSLPAKYSQLAGILDFTGASLHRPDGTIVWAAGDRPGKSGDASPSTIVVANPSTAGPSTEWAQTAVEVGSSSARIDVVSVFVPVQSGPHGPVIGMLQAYRDITPEFVLHVVQKSAGNRKIIAMTMGGVYAAFLCSLVVAGRVDGRPVKPAFDMPTNGQGPADVNDEPVAGDETALQQAAEIAFDGVITLDRTGKICGWDVRAERTLGWDACEAIGRHIEFLFAPTRLISRLRETFDTGAAGASLFLEGRFDVQGKHRDGQLVALELMATKGFKEGEQVCRLFLRDVTGQKQVEESFRQSSFENASLAEIGALASRSESMDELTSAIAPLVIDLMSADRFSLGFIDVHDATIKLRKATIPGGRRMAGGATFPVGGTVAEEAIRSGQPLVLNTSELAVRSATDRIIAEEIAEGAGCELVVPVVGTDGPLGCIFLSFLVPDSITPSGTALARRIAEQIIGPIQNLLENRRFNEAIREQERLIEISRLVPPISGCSDETFNYLSDYLKRSVPFDWVYISTLVDGETCERLLWMNGDPAYKPTAADAAPLTGSATGAVIKARRGLLLKNENSVTLTRRHPLVARYLQEQARSSLSVPLFVSDEALGALHLLYSHQDVYGEPDIRFLEQVARQIGPSVYSVVLGQEIERRTIEEETLERIGRICASSVETGECFGQLTTCLSVLFTFDMATLSTVDPERNVICDRRVICENADRVDRSLYEPLEGTLAGETILVEEGCLVSVESPDRILDLYPGSTWEHVSGICSAACVPLTFNGIPAGVLQILSTKPGAFSNSDLGLLQRAGDLLAGLVANERLHSELVQDASEREVLAEIGRIVSSSLELDDVYSSFAEQVRRLISYDRLAVYALRENTRTLDVRHVTGMEIPGALQGGTVSLSTTIEALFPGKLGRIEGGSGPSPYRSTQDVGQALSFQGSVMYVPLVSADRIHGILEFGSQIVGVYTESHLALAERIAGQIAGAVSRADLHGRIRRESYERAVLAEIGRLASSSGDLADVYGKVACRIGKLVAFDTVYVATLDPGSRTLTVRYVAGDESAAPTPSSVLSAESTVAGNVALSGKSRLERTRKSPDKPDGSEQARGDSLMAVPLMFEGRPMGSLTLIARDRRLFDERDLSVAEQVAVQVAGAVARSQLYAELTLRGAALEAAADMVVITDADGQIDYVNQAFVRHTGYTKQEATGKTPRLLKSGRQDSRFYEELWSTILAGNVWEGTLVNRRKDGTEYPEEMTITPLRGEDGQISRFVAIKRDVTDRWKAEEERVALQQLDAENRELQRVNEARSQFVSTVSHELRTPLTSVIAFADILARNRPKNLNPKQVEQVDAIRRSAVRLQALINDLLDVSRIDSGRFRLEETEFDARQLFEEVIDSFEPIFAAKYQVLDTSVPDRPLVVYADRYRVSQVVSNLLLNASKYSHENSTIEMTVQPKAGSLLVEIRDPGIGISEEDQEQLFTPFFRADNEETRSQPGTGLGLVIAKSIVESHGGELTLESERGEGTTFRFTLPRLVYGKLTRDRSTN